MSAYENIHGQPSSVSARDAVLAVVPEAVCIERKFVDAPMWMVRKTPRKLATVIGTGANEEAAWRDAWSRMLAEDVQREQGA